MIGEQKINLQGSFRNLLKTNGGREFREVIQDGKVDFKFAEGEFF